jgi:hypothetical protein
MPQCPISEPVLWKMNRPHIIRVTKQPKASYSGMKTRLALRIDDPCSQKWSEMTPTEKGRFCDSCQKKVFDVTTLTDNEILQMAKEHPHGFCGQFRKDQLNRAIIETQFKNKSRLNAFVAGVFVALGAGTASAQSAPSHTVQTQVIDKDHPTGPVCVRDTTPSAGKDVEVTVIVHADSLTGNTLQSAQVTLSGTTISAYTDSTGKAVLTIPAAQVSDSMTFTVGYIGYASKDIVVSAAKASETVVAVLTEQIWIIYGGAVAYDWEEEIKPVKEEKKKSIFRKNK